MELQTHKFQKLNLLVTISESSHFPCYIPLYLIHPVTKNILSTQENTPNCHFGLLIL